MKIYLTIVASNKDTDFEFKPTKDSKEKNGSVVAFKDNLNLAGASPEDIRQQVATLFQKAVSALEDEVAARKVEANNTDE